MAERVAARLRPDREAVRLLADLDLVDRALRRLDPVDDVVVAAREPQVFAVGADVAHVGAAAARDRPGLLDLAGGEVDHGDAAWAARLAADLVAAAVGDVEL